MKVLVGISVILFCSVIVFSNEDYPESVTQVSCGLSFISGFLAQIIWESTEKSKKIMEQRKKSNYKKMLERDPMKAILYAQVKAYENTGEMINPFSDEVTADNSGGKRNKSVGVIDYLDSATASWCPVCGGKMEGGPGGNRRHFCPSCGQMFDSNGNAVN